MFSEALKSLRFRVEFVTPSLARAWLEKNVKNRTIGPGFVEQYAEEIHAGGWMVNGQSIIFNREGNLLDGQHRLHAVVESGISVPMTLVEGVDDAAFQTMDQGHKRTFAGYLSITGELNCSALGSAIRFLYQHHSNVARYSTKPSIPDLFDFLRINPGLRDSVQFIISHRPKRRDGEEKPQASWFDPGPFAALHYLTTTRHPTEVADNFWCQLMTGGKMEPGTPVHLLRELLTTTARTNKKYKPVVRQALLIKAFNATIRGETVKCLKWRPDEAFPDVA